MRYTPDWEQTKEKWRSYWNHCNTGRIVKKFGSHSLFLHFSERSYEQGRGYVLANSDSCPPGVKQEYLEKLSQLVR